ncbi:MAG: hypothetical protein HY690_12315 [Chloroflexi bacterium]|nr:hypothetical protein [Chloroflexota bacterium]
MKVEAPTFSLQPPTSLLGLSAAALFLLAGCGAPATPSPTAAPPKPAATAPAPPATPVAKVAPSPVASPAAKPAASPEPAAKVDTKALEAFYKGKTMRIIVGFAPGGGYDTYSRTIARHLGKYIPGNPTVIVENMPGAGSLLSVNHTANVAAKDGTVIGNFSTGAVVQQVYGTPGVEFDAAKLNFLGVPARDHSICVATKVSGFKSIQEIIGPGAKQITVGADAPGSATVDDPSVMREALGANFKIVQGYSGTSRSRLAMEQGEVEGLCGLTWESLKTSSLDKVQSGEWVLISQNTEQALKELPNVPVAADFAKTPEARQLFHFGVVLVGQPQRQYVAPPGVPAERVQLLREALAQTLKDKELLADAEKAKLDLEPIGGEDDQKLISELLAMPADIKAKLKTILRPS